MTINITGFARIGITPDINGIAHPEREYSIRCNYADTIQHAGGLPLILPYSDNISAYLANIDGLLITGGMFDIDPGLYGQEARKPYVEKPLRTAFEKALIQGALKRELPILGICNGMQLLAVCLGGQLIQDIGSEVLDTLEHKPKMSATIAHHKISITGYSRNLGNLETDDYFVNSVHHQAVLPFEAYKTIAVAEDGIIEAIEATGGGFALGVQWHPEYLVSKIDQLIWRGFVAAAAEYSLRRQPPQAGR